MNSWFGNISVNLKLGLGFGLVLVLTSILALTGCLLSCGYAGFQSEDATRDALDGQAAAGGVRAGAPQ